MDAASIAARAGRGIAPVPSYRAAEDIAAGRLVSPSLDHRPARVSAFLGVATEALRALPVIAAAPQRDERPDSC